MLFFLLKLLDVQAFTGLPTREGNGEANPNENFHNF